jgi:hypothetical protein
MSVDQPVQIPAGLLQIHDAALLLVTDDVLDDVARCEANVVQRRMVPSFKKSFERAVALPKEVQHWLLTTLREKLVKIGAKVIRHGRYVTFQIKCHGI